MFYDESAKLISDYYHSEDEAKFILLGVSNTLRIILARKATAKKSKAY